MQIFNDNIGGSPMQQPQNPSSPFYPETGSQPNNLNPGSQTSQETLSKQNDPTTYLQQENYHQFEPAQQTQPQQNYQHQEITMEQHNQYVDDGPNPDSQPNPVWDNFQYRLKNKHEYRQPKDYPRKPMMVDADLCSTLREIDIENVSPTNLLNIILRSFIETNKDELLIYRKPQAPSVF